MKKRVFPGGREKIIKKSFERYLKKIANLERKENEALYITKVACDNCNKVLRDDGKEIAKEHIYFKFSELGWVAPTKKDEKGNQRFEIKVKLKSPEPGKRKKYLHFCDPECVIDFMRKYRFAKFVAKDTEANEAYLSKHKKPF